MRHEGPLIPHDNQIGHTNGGCRWRHGYCGRVTFFRVYANFLLKVLAATMIGERTGLKGGA
jgi:hypothetical protein